MTDARGLPDQRPSRVRLEWGLTGARSLVGAGAPTTLAIVVDVLSFSTTVTVACERGTVVHPYPSRDGAGAQDLARRTGATLARPRGDGRVSLSPASLVHVALDRLVLPSPNGSTIAHELLSTGADVIAGCLRNAGAVAEYALDHLARSDQHDVVLVAAGERWPDSSLRPCVEDHLGAGAILSVVLASEPGLSPEARLAATLWHGTPDPAGMIRASTSGRELAEAGWGDDVDLAVQANVTTTVPRLRDDGVGPAFRGTTEVHVPTRSGPAIRPWTLLSEAPFTAPAGHLRLATRTYRLPDGRESDWDLIVGGRTVAVLALTADGQVVLVRQFRPGPARILDEMPGGYVDDGEDVAAAAGRELLEETGYAGEIEVLGSTFLSASATTVRHVAVARDCVRVGPPSPEGDEFCEPRLVSLAQFRAQLREGALTDTDLGYQALDLLGLLT